MSVQDDQNPPTEAAPTDEALLTDDVALEGFERARLEQLLIDEVTQGVGSAEREELELLLGADNAEEVTDDSLNWDSPLDDLHRTVAAAELALTGPGAEGAGAPDGESHQMPAVVESDLRQLARREAKRIASGQGVVVPIESARVTTLGLSPAWWVAAAASFLALLGWWPKLPFVDAPDTASLAAAERARPSTVTFASANDTRSLLFQRTEDPAGAAANGRVRWNARLQDGDMRIEGLMPNDPTEFQYQLWIFDADRDSRHPVDGGVFNVPSTGVATIDIDPRVPVREATLFAITIEPPGGVVVSTRDRIVLAAQLDA